MPSDETMRAVLAAVSPAAEPWKTAVALTAEELRGILAGPATAAAAAHALGRFASGRIDVDRFAGLVGRTQPMEDAALLRLRVAYDTLRALASRAPEDLLVTRVPAGANLGDCVAEVLEQVGRAFGAAREAAAVRSGTFRESQDGTQHEGLAFRRWSRRDRRLAPPLVVAVQGADLVATDLVEFLDGTVRIALVVRGPCPPAALVRLVTPGTFVMQTTDPAALARLAAHDGPGVAALVETGAALFTHDPAAGRTTWERMKVDHVPAEPPRSAVGVFSAEQQAEDLRQLAALATRPSAAAMAAAAAAAPAAERGAVTADPVGSLAGWLLEAAGTTPGAATAAANGSRAIHG